MNFWEQICCALQTRCHLMFFLPYGPMLMKTKENWQKSKIWNFANLYTSLVETFPSSSMCDSLELICNVLSGHIVVFFHIGFCVNEKLQIIKNIIKKASHPEPHALIYFNTHILPCSLIYCDMNTSYALLVFLLDGIDTRRGCPALLFLEFCVSMKFCSNHV